MGKPCSGELAALVSVWPCPDLCRSDSLQTDPPKVTQGPRTLPPLLRLGLQGNLLLSLEAVCTGQGLPDHPLWHVWPPDLTPPRGLGSRFPLAGVASVATCKACPHRWPGSRPIRGDQSSASHAGPGGHGNGLALGPLLGLLL